jgi:hypothetical protein
MIRRRRGLNFWAQIATILGVPIAIISIVVSVILARQNSSTAPLSVSGSTHSVMPTFFQADRLGGLDLNAYCQQHGYFEAFPRSRMVADSWVCRGNNHDTDLNTRQKSIKMDEACAWQYAAVAEQGEVKAVAEDRNNPDRWFCYALAATEPYDAE